MKDDVLKIVARLAKRDAERAEANVQADVRQFLLTAGLNLGEDDVQVVLEAQAGDRKRIDVELGTTVIEAKKDLRVGNVLADAIDQLQGYVERRQKKFGCRYVGIITDGAEWRCYHLDQGRLAEVSIFRLGAARADADALKIWLEGVLATSQGVKPTPDVIGQRLGATSSSHALDRATVAALYAQNASSAFVRTKRRLWAYLLRTAQGTQFSDKDDLFIEHTLLVNSAKVIAHALVGFPLGGLVPASMLSGAKFEESGIHGVVEPDFFDWVLDVPGGEVFVRTLMRRLARFDWTAVDHDVLKVLYESVIPADTRKKLGEYYTPDWLAEQVVEKVITSPLSQRVLDPACGSGTFLFHAVRAYLAAAERKKLTLSKALDGVTQHVFGMDLHPVAVTLARVTYLLAIGRERLTSDDRGIVQIPVYVGDSLQWHRKTRELFSPDEFTIEVNDKAELFQVDFKFPNSLLADPLAFDELVKDLAARASAKGRTPGKKPPSLSPLFHRHAIPSEAHAAVTASFQTMCRLHDEGRDHVWGFYIRNAARPEWLARPQNRVDVLIGNPPWLAFRFMPKEMQADFRALSESRRLWHGQRMATQQDLSALFVVRMCELYLRLDGSFAFVMPNAVMDRGQYAGFRQGNYDDGKTQVRLQLSEPWSLRKIRPHIFPIGSAVVFGKRSDREAAMPVACEEWSGHLAQPSGRWDQVAESIRKSAAKSRTETPQGETSKYKGRFRNGASLFPRLLCLVEKTKAGPLGQVAGRVTVRSLRSAYEKKPWKELPPLEGVVETEFLRPAYLGECLLPYRLLPPALAIIPHDTSGMLDPQGERIDHYPGLAGWYRDASDCWRANQASAKLTLLERLDYHGSLASQLSIRQLRVAYTKSGMHLSAARIADRRAVLDHTLYWATARSLEETQYLCAILNSEVVTELVRPLMAYGKDERHIDKAVWKLPIPEFDENKDLHKELATLGEKAEDLVQALPLAEAQHFVRQRQLVRKALSESGVGKRIEASVKKLMRRTS